MCFRKFARLPVITLIKIIIDNISDIQTARIFIFLFLHNERSFSTEIFTEIKKLLRKDCYNSYELVIYAIILTGKNISLFRAFTFMKLTLKISAS